MYAWLISRRFLPDITGTKEMDDEIRVPIFSTLEAGYTSPEDLKRACRNQIPEAVNNNEELKKAMGQLLAKVNSVIHMSLAEIKRVIL